MAGILERFWRATAGGLVAAKSQPKGKPGFVGSLALLAQRNGHGSIPGRSSCLSAPSSPLSEGNRGLR